MMICPKCQKPIRYIVSGDNIIAVNLEEKQLVSDSGRILKGFETHICDNNTDNNTGGDNDET